MWNTQPPRVSGYFKLKHKVQHTWAPWLILKIQLKGYTLYTAYSSEQGLMVHFQTQVTVFQISSCDTQKNKLWGDLMSPTFTVKLPRAHWVNGHLCTSIGPGSRAKAGSSGFARCDSYVSWLLFKSLSKLRSSHFERKKTTIKKRNLKAEVPVTHKCPLGTFCWCFK